MRRRLGSLAGLALIALLGSGCSNAPPENDTGTSADNYETAMRFADCMRENGVGAFPDPEASGELTIDGVLNGSSLDPNTPAWKAAIGACKDLQPSGFTGDDEVSAEEREARLEFARCIRENGVEDFPDPVDGEPLVDTNRIPSAADGDGMSILNAAMETCRDLGSEAIDR